ncbi:MAG: BLUF domain-containing protein [Steroidobacteraceae bacterium]
MDLLYQCIYSSVAIEHLDARAVGQLLDDSRRANEAAGITGMLLQCNGSFLQVLEGRPDALENAFEWIYSDPRHNAIAQIAFEPVTHRAFGDWSMAYTDLAVADIAKIIGPLNAFQETRCLAKLDAARVRVLCSAFETAPWRDWLHNDVHEHARSA